MKPRKIKLYLALIWVIALPVFAHGAQEKIAVKRFAVCLNEDPWKFQPAIPGAWLKIFHNSVNSSNPSVIDFARIWKLKSENKNESRDLFLSAWQGALLVRANLPLAAYDIFADAVAKHSHDGNHAALLAQLACIGDLQKKYRSLDLPDSVLKVALELSSQTKTERERATVNTILYLAGLGELAKDNPSAMLSSITKSFRNADSSMHFLGALAAGRNAAYQSVLEQIKPIEPLLPKIAASTSNSLYLLQGQSLYSLQNFGAATKAWSHVKPDSNQFAASLLGTAWAHLSENKYGDAVGASYNLLVGPLQHTFQPEAFLVIAIAMNEICDFPRAIETINSYKRAYGKTYTWLHQWEQKKESLYPTLVSFLQDEAKVPAYVGLEWARNPLFLASQEEINQRIVERKWLVAIPEKTAGGAALLDYVKTAKDANSGHEKNLVKMINESLERDTVGMLKTLAYTSDNLQLVQAEVFNSVGEKMILDNAGMAGKASEKQDKSSSTGAVWDWGTISSSSDDNSEFWEDELGFIKADVTSQCTK